MSGPILRSVWNTKACADPESERIQDVVSLGSRLPSTTALIADEEGSKMPNGNLMAWKIADVELGLLPNMTKEFKKLHAR
jgi:hypothetical protein